MSVVDQTDGLVTLTVTPGLLMAQLIKSQLEAEGIEAHIPDQHLVAVAWHLTSAIGGVRVQVSSADLEEARRILNEGVAPEEVGMAATVAADTTAASEQSSQPLGEGQADAVAYRAFRVALLGTLLGPLLHPWALSLAWEAAAQREALSPQGRRWLRIAFLWSTVVLALSLFVLLQMLRSCSPIVRPAP